MSRARSIAVIGGNDTIKVDRAVRRLIARRGIARALTDDALHELALMLIEERGQTNRSAAASRKHYATRVSA